MINSVGSTGTQGLLESLMKEMTTKQNVDISLVKKSLDIEKAQGEAALKLIDSASSAGGAGQIDVHV